MNEIKDSCENAF